MHDRVYLFRVDCDSYYKYRKEIRRYRDAGYIVRNIYGGVVCFRHPHDYDIWKNQK